MTKNSDEMAFEEFVVKTFNIAPELISDFKHTFTHKLRHTEEAFKSGIAHERKRSDDLVNNITIALSSLDKWLDPATGIIRIKMALQEYQAREE